MTVPVASIIHDIKMVNCKSCSKSIKNNQSKIYAVTAAIHTMVTVWHSDDIAYHMSENQPWRYTACSVQRQELEMALDEGAVIMADIIKMLDQTK